MLTVIVGFMALVVGLFIGDRFSTRIDGEVNKASESTAQFYETEIAEIQKIYDEQINKLKKKPVKAVA